MKQTKTLAVVLCLTVAMAAAAPSFGQAVFEIKTNAAFFNPAPNGNVIMHADTGSASDDFGEFRFRENGADRWGLGYFNNGDQFYVWNYQLSNYGLIVDAQNDVGINCFSNTTNDFTIGSGAVNCLGGTYSTINAGQTQFTASSSRTIKENLEPLVVDGLLDKITGAKVYNYDFIDGQKGAIGLMAEDFHQIFERGSDKMLSGHEVQVALWLAVQELTEQNRELKARLDAIEKK